MKAKGFSKKLHSLNKDKISRSEKIHYGPKQELAQHQEKKVGAGGVPHPWAGPNYGGSRVGRIWLLGAQLGLGRWQATGPFQIEAKRWQIEQLDAVNKRGWTGRAPLLVSEERRQRQVQSDRLGGENGWEQSSGERAKGRRGTGRSDLAGNGPGRHRA